MGDALGYLDRRDMLLGRPDIGIGAMHFYNSYFVEHGMWPDLLVVARNGWQLPLLKADDSAALLFNAGHGSPETGEVMLAIRGLGYPPGVTCDELATLADVARTIADSWGIEFPMTVGVPLACSTAQEQAN